MGGATGPTCMATIAGCAENCNNNGLCMNGKCMCGPGWMGATCHKKFFAPGQKPPKALKKDGTLGDDTMKKSGPSGGGPNIVGLGSDASDLADDGGDAPETAGGGGGSTTDMSGAPSAAPAGGKMTLSKASGGVICGEGGFCSGHGKCDTATASCVCVGDFFGDVCERQHCAGFFTRFQTSKKECNGKGMCEMGQCSCAPGWGMGPSRQLAAIQEPQQCLDKVCPVGCGMHGKCVEGACTCQQGWQGPNCKDPQCPNDCAGHGQCSFQSVHSPGQCICNYGWGGAGCQRAAVYTQLKTCPNDCGGNGLCMDGMCACNVGFKGPDCTDRVCSAGLAGPKCDQPRCKDDCSGRGLCMNGMCACWGFYAGPSCNMPVQCATTCSAICDSVAEGAEQRCNACVGMCESAAPKSSSVFGGPALGVHNPFEDLQSTLLQQNATAIEASSEWTAMQQKNELHKKHSGHHTEVSATRIAATLQSVFF